MCKQRDVENTPGSTKGAMKMGGRHQGRLAKGGGGGVDEQTQGPVGEELPAIITYYSETGRKARREEVEAGAKAQGTSKKVRWRSTALSSNTSLTSSLAKAKIRRAAQFNMNPSPHPLLVNIWLQPHSDIIKYHTHHCIRYIKNHIISYTIISNTFVCFLMSSRFSIS